MTLRVGLTGGIGSGKSTVSALLRERGAVVIDYDLLAREIVEPGQPALQEIVARFGPQILRPDGTLDRPALGAVVFSDAAARRDLEAITHPAIRRRAEEIEQAAGPDAVVIHDNPLLVEMGAAEHCDVVVVVDVPEKLQIERLVRDRQMTPEDAAARIAAQASRRQRNAAADHLIDNSGTKNELVRTVGGLWDELVRSG